MKLKLMIVIGILALAVVAIGDLRFNGSDVFEDYGNAFRQDAGSPGSPREIITKSKNDAMNIPAEKVSAIEIEPGLKDVTVKGVEGLKNIEVKYTVQASGYNNASFLKALDKVKIIPVKNGGNVRFKLDGGDSYFREPLKIKVELSVPAGVGTLKMLHGQFGFGETGMLTVVDYPGTVNLDGFRGNLVLKHVGSVSGSIFDSNIQVNEVGGK